MQIIPDWLANIHPIIVHFPIALLFTAVLFDFLGLIKPTNEWMKKGAVWLFVLGALGLVAAFLSGRSAVNHLPIPRSLYHAIGEHEEWAERTLWFYGIYASLRLIIVWWNQQRSRVISGIVFIIGLLGLFLVFETGEHGGNLVFNHGIGTNPYINIQKQAAQKFDFNGPESPVVGKGGGWAWKPGGTGPVVLQNSFRWINGAASDLKPTMVVSGRDTLLDLTADAQPSMFVFNSDLSDVMATVRIDLDQFNGYFSIIDHFRDANNYEFMSLANDQMIQGRVTDGKSKVMAESHIEKKTGLQVLQVVISGDHIFGKLNGEEIIHTHAVPLNAGSVGLKIQGKGKIQLQYLGALPVTGSPDQ